MRRRNWFGREPCRAARFGWLRFLALCMLGMTLSLPFVWMVSASFKPRREVDEIGRAHV